MKDDDGMEQNNRFAIVVIGMHRSGTSALGGVLTRLGCDAPVDLIEPRPMNEKGFFESNTISNLDEDILSSAGSNWFTWQPLNTEWFRSVRAEERRDLASDALTNAYGDARLPMLKDPRMCRLVPFWDQILQQAGYAPRYIHTHRHPLEVAQSLQHWAGYDPAYGLLLWLRYALEGEAGTRGKARVFTSYATVLGDWQRVLHDAARKLDVVWPRQSDRVTAEIDEFLDVNLRHMKTSGRKQNSGVRMTPWVTEVYDILERWCETGEDPEDYRALDSIRALFDKATVGFSSAVEAGRRDSLSLQRKAMEEKKQRANIERLEGEVATQTEKAARAESEIVAVKAAHDSALAERDQGYSAELAALKAAHESAVAEREQGYAAEISDLNREFRLEKLSFEKRAREELADAIRAVRQRGDDALQGAEDRIAAALDEIQRLRGDRDAAQTRLEALESSTSWRLTGPVRWILDTLRGFTRHG